MTAYLIAKAHDAALKTYAGPEPGHVDASPIRRAANAAMRSLLADLRTNWPTGTRTAALLDALLEELGDGE